MPPRSAEEKARRRLLHQQKRDARRRAKEAEEKAEEEAAKSNKTNTTNHGTTPSNHNDNTHPSCRLSLLPEESIRRILTFCNARELGVMGIASRMVNYGMKESKISHFLGWTRGGEGEEGAVGEGMLAMKEGKRGKRRRRLGRVEVDWRLCEDEEGARKAIERSLQGSNGDYRYGNTHRLITKKSAKGRQQRSSDAAAAGGGDADEYVSYAKFLEEALFGGCGSVLQDKSSSSPTPLPPTIPNGRFASLSPEHSLLRHSGTPPATGLTSWGVGRRGQLGHNNRTDLPSPTRLLHLGFTSQRIIQVAAGGGLVRVAHSLLLTSSGRVMSFGNGQYGQLGHGYSPGKTLPDVLKPRIIEANGFGNVRCISISAGELHSAAVSSDGDVYTWGEGFCGQLGGGDKRPRCVPVMVEGELEDECVASVSCGARHTLCVTECEEDGGGGGEVFSFGLGFWGVLGRSYTEYQYHRAEEEEQGGEGAAGIVDAYDDTVATSNLDLPSASDLTLDDTSDQCYPKRMEFLEEEGVRIVGASAGHRHSILLDTKGRVYTCGLGSGGALGHGDDLSKKEYPKKILEFEYNNVDIVQISAGVDISMAVSSTGNVYSWGKSGGGRIGHSVANDADIRIPTRVMLKDEDGEEEPVVDVECGYVHSLIIGLSGAVYECGGVGVDGAEDGHVAMERADVDGADGGGENGGGKSGRPVRLRGMNIWHRIAAPKEEKKDVKWKKYGKYELKGRSTMMAEKDKWGV